MKKRFKPKKRFKKTIYLILVLVIGIALINTNENDIFIKNSNYVSLYKQNNDFFINRVVKKIKMNFNLINIMSNKFKTKQVFKAKDDIYIYSSHQYEEYKYMQGINITPNVITASYLFKESLEQYGYKVLIEETDFEKFKKENNYDYDDSYYVSKLFTQNKILNNDYKLIIDLHRDAPLNTNINIDNKSYATVLFVVGEKYNNQINYDLAKKISDTINKKYPKLSRGVSIQGNTYNQELNNKMILFELGGCKNTINEVSNTIDIVTPIINEVLNES